jgi:GNAT superfamily N-acetyltransferase
MIVDLRLEPGTDWIGQIVAGHRFLPYWWLRRVTPESRRAMMNSELHQALADPQASLLGYLADGVLVGFAHTRRVRWASQHFGVEVYVLRHLGVWGAPTHARERACHLVQASAEVARARGAATIHTWVPVDDIVVLHSLEEAGYRTMDVPVTWIFDFSKTPIPGYRLAKGSTVRGYRPGDEGPLARLAGLISSRHMPNRFQADPHLPAEACDELYHQWMLDSIFTDLADYISVAEWEGEVVGYSSLKCLGDRGSLCNLRLSELELVAVVPEMRERGLANQMRIHNLRWLEDKADIVYVVTQANNVAAQMGVAHLGFRPVRAGLSMHLWLDR